MPKSGVAVRILAALLVVVVAVAGLILFSALPAPIAGTPTALPAAPTRLLPNAPAPTISSAISATPAAPDHPEPLPPLIFARSGQLWQSDGGDDAPQQLTTFAANETASQPALSPDGRRIAFVTLTQPAITATIALPTARLDVFDRKSGDVQTLWHPSRGILWLPSWSHDGAAVYLFANGTGARSTDDSERLQIVRIDLASGERTTILRKAMDPCISPDGAQIAYLTFGDDGVHMHLMVANVDGSQPRRVLDGSAFQGLFAPRWSPDGSMLTVAGLNGPPTNADGIPASAAMPWSWAWLAEPFEPPVAEAHGAPWDMWSVNMDGTGLRRIAAVQDDMPMAAFSPDGSQIVIMAYQGFYQLDRDGSHLRRIAKPGDHGGIAWDTQAAP